MHPSSERGTITLVSEAYDVVVIGAGAMGSAAAWSLAAAGREVTVLEKRELGHAGGGSHGGSRLFRLDYSSQASLELARQAEPLWRRLESESGTVLLEQVGGVEHGVRPDRLESAVSLCAVAGVPVNVLPAEAANEFWPEMVFENAVLHQPGSGRLYADRAIATLQRLAADTGGAEFRPQTPVLGLDVLDQGDGVGAGLVEIRTAEETLRARQVVATVGSWATGLLVDVLDLPPITVTQEQPRHFRPRATRPDWPVFVHWGGSDGALVAYGVHEEGVGVKVGIHRSGPVVDPDERSGPDPDVDAVLIDYVRRWCPGLDADVSTPISCLYDNSPDETFVIDRVGPVTVATGFSGEGFKFVPVIGELLRDLVAGAAAAPDRFRLGAHRFASAPTLESRRPPRPPPPKGEQQ